MRSAFSPFAIAARLFPAARSRRIRSHAYGDMLGGRPSRTPCARFVASARRMCCERSHELEQGLRGPLPLVGDERLPVGALEYPPRLLDPGTLEVDSREAGVLERLEELP